MSHVFLDKAEISRLEQKIEAVEALTSAEFRIIITPHAWGGLKRKAHKLFHKYQLDNTSVSNAVLILLVEKDHKLLIYGDAGIHEKLGNTFWDTISENMLELFRDGKIADGLSVGLQLLSDVLSEHFPIKENPANEISNEIIFD
jgi:uncharacterized membrane protein